MDFSQSESQKMIADMCRDFAEKNIRPKMMEWDESQEFPVPLFKEMGQLGLMGILVPE
ncbi:MAG: acyl-CoA dehydrogenase family protein, partial [Flavobacteriales bacterium]|nr:acyl-CoA dehydrogenase family protein [Flavobacteriales bacterium]